MSHARISVTLPPEILAAADRRARELDRSRSWVVADALRTLVTSPGSIPGSAARVREPPQTYGPAGTGLGPSRTAQLVADMALSTHDRVRAAEETARVGEAVRPSPPVHRVLSFERYEDYLEWKFWENVRP